MLLDLMVLTCRVCSLPSWHLCLHLSSCMFKILQPRVYSQPIMLNPILWVWHAVGSAVQILATTTLTH